MNKLLPALLSLLAPLAAQVDLKRPVKSADYDAAALEQQMAEDQAHAEAPRLDLLVRANGSLLGMRASSNRQDESSFGLIFGNCTGAVVEIDGLGAWLEPHCVFVAGPLSKPLELVVPFKGLPYDLYLQAGALVAGQILLSEVAVVDRVHDGA